MNPGEAHPSRVSLPDLYHSSPVVKCGASHCTAASRLGGPAKADGVPSPGSSPRDPYGSRGTTKNPASLFRGAGFSVFFERYFISPIPAPVCSFMVRFPAGFVYVLPEIESENSGKAARCRASPTCNRGLWTRDMDLTEVLSPCWVLLCKHGTREKVRCQVESMSKCCGQEM